jgi:hypothetical protein
MKQRDPDRPNSINVVRPEDVINALNAEALDPDVYRSVIARRRSSGRTVADLLRSDSSRKEFDQPGPPVTTTRLRQLVDEWIATGLTSGEESPWDRKLARTNVAVAAVKNCAAANPCTLYFHDETAELVLCVGVAPRSRRDLFPFDWALAEADRLFTGMMSAGEWKYQVCKCAYPPCGSYFLHPKPRAAYRRGTFCSRKHQRRASADAITKSLRSDLYHDLLAHAAELLTEWKKGPGWHDDKALKSRLAAEVSRLFNEKPRYQAVGQGVKVNWVTRHRLEIEKRRRELVKLR